MKQQQLKHHNGVCEEGDNEEYFDQYISEECKWCEIEMTRVEDILFDKNSGNYCCKECNDYYRLGAVECRDIY